MIKFIKYISNIIGDWGLGIGEWGPSPNPQPPTPKPHTPKILN